MKNVQYYSAFFHAKGEIKIAVSIEDEASKDLPPAACSIGQFVSMFTESCLAWQKAERKLRDLLLERTDFHQNVCTVKSIVCFPRYLVISLCIFKALEESWLSSPWESPHKGEMWPIGLLREEDKPQVVFLSNIPAVVFIQ